MPIINHLVNDLIDQHEVFTNTLFVEHPTVVSENFHHSVQDVENRRRLNVVLGRCHEVDAEFLGEEVVDAVNILKREGINNLTRQNRDISCVLTKAGGGSPGQNLTLRKNTSLVGCFMSNLTITRES